MKIITFTIIYVHLCSYYLEGQNTVTSSNIFDKNIPKNINYKGKVINAANFTDKTGEYLVFTTETGVYDSEIKNDEIELSDAYIYAFLFSKKNNQYVKIWQVQDFITNCPLDIEAKYVKNTFKITDLDRNGIAEIWLMYRKVCRGDVGPSEMKIIMYEGSKKYAIRGENKVFLQKNEDFKDEYLGGNYNVDQAFKDGPTIFLNFAKKID